MLFICLVGLLLAADYDLTRPVGYGAKATGGSGGTVVKVTTRTELYDAIRLKGSAIVVISSTITISGTDRMSAEVINKTIVALPGVKLINLEQTQENSGVLTFKSGSDNVIVRNIIFEGPGAYDVDGHDLVTNEGCTNLWVDHCEFYDGVDGNFDNSKKADNITASWCIFGYKKPPKSGGSGGSDDHRFSNLVGGSDSDAPSDGHYSITYYYCYWSDGCRERMPRARNAEIHVLNCLYNTNVASSTAMGYSAGKNGLTSYVEGCNFKKVGTVIKADYGGSPSVTFVNCLNGGTNVGSTVSRPSYSYSAIDASKVEATITGSCGAGAVLKVDSNGNISC